MILMQTPAYLWFCLILFMLSITFMYLENNNIINSRFVKTAVVMLFIIHDYLPMWGGVCFLYKYGEYAIYF